MKRVVARLKVPNHLWAQIQAEESFISLFTYCFVIYRGSVIHGCKRLQYISYTIYTFVLNMFILIFFVISLYLVLFYFILFYSLFTLKELPHTPHPASTPHHGSDHSFVTHPPMFSSAL
jgi:hypothetical protein